VKKLLIAGAALAGLVGFGGESRAGDKDAAPPRLYRIDLKIVECDAEGNKSVVCQPTFVTRENDPARSFAGQKVETSEDRGKAEYLVVGTSAEVVVRPLPGGKVRLDASVQYSWRESGPQSKIRVRSSGVRAVETVRLGETFREELDTDPSVGGRQVIEITVQEADQTGK
jgi:hypothetical protein